MPAFDDFKPEVHKLIMCLDFYKQNYETHKEKGH